MLALIKQAPVSALYYVFKPCCAQRLQAKGQRLSPHLGTRPFFCANKENWLQVPKEFVNSGNHNYVKAFLNGVFTVLFSIKNKTLALVSLSSVTPLDIWVLASTEYV